jgi:ABC-type glutathione transport system ATPase component
MIEHHVPLVVRVCDYVYVLNFGELLTEGLPDDVRRHPEVVAAYLGGEAPEALASTEETAEDEALDASLHHAAEPAPARVPAKKAATKKAATKKAPAKKAATKVSGTSAAKKAPAAKKAAARRTGKEDS